MPTNSDETLLERYQREHRVYEGMNMSEHTPGKLRIGTPPPNGEQTIGTENGLMVAVATRGVDMPTEANARRIVAAWNYCNEHSTGYLEKASAASATAGKTLMADFQRDVDRMSAINAELLSFVNEYVEAFENGMAGDSYLLRIARAAIAKAQGEQP